MRQKTVKNFNDSKSDLQIVVADINTTAFGLDLHACCRRGTLLALHSQAQATGQIFARLTRIGQTKTVSWHVKLRRRHAVCGDDNSGFFSVITVPRRLCFAERLSLLQERRGTCVSPMPHDSEAPQRAMDDAQHLRQWLPEDSERRHCPATMMALVRGRLSCPTR